MIISRAPVRLSMGGGGTDLPSYYEKYEGFLMAAAINKYVFITANKRFNESIRLSYSKTEIVDRPADIEHNIFRELLHYMKIDSQIELVSVSDVPANSGLGTSSSFTVALASSLSTYKKEFLTLRQLAEVACHIEINVLGKPIGKQDQYAATFGGFNAYWFHKDGSVSVEPVNIRNEVLRDLQNNLLLFYIESQRSAETVLDVQDKKSKQGDQATLERLHRIKEIGLHTRKLFEQGKIDEFGEILHEHWLAKKGLSNLVSTSYIDEIYETARRNGALGGKIVGAGGGGFLLLYCPRDRSGVVSALEKMGLSPTWFAFENSGVTVVYQH